MMKTRGSLSLVAAGALAAISVHAVPAAAEETVFARRGTSAAATRQASAQCWRVAQRAKLTEDQANQNLVTGYLVGGVIGVLVVASQNDDANKNPRSAFRQEVHDACMTKRGYRKVE
jgi:hypothetical protein